MVCSDTDIHGRPSVRIGRRPAVASFYTMMAATLAYIAYSSVPAELAPRNGRTIQGHPHEYKNYGMCSVASVLIQLRPPAGRRAEFTTKKKVGSAHTHPLGLSTAGV